MLLYCRRKKETIAAHPPTIMRRVLTLCLALLLIATVHLHAEEVVPPSASTAENGSITIHILGLKAIVGMLGVSLYNSSKGFPADHTKACATVLKKVSGTTDEVVFNNLPYGTYAVSVLHDENSNGKLDTKSYLFFSIPKEGIGVSNNPKARRGPPKYEECSVTLDAQQLETTISMRYF